MNDTIIEFTIIFMLSSEVIVAGNLINFKSEIDLETILVIDFCISGNVGTCKFLSNCGLMKINLI